MPLIALSTSQVYFEQVGSGPPVVMIHAGIADHRMWDPQLDVLADRTVIRYDVRGYGRSPSPAGDYQDFVDLTDLLDHLGIPAATLVGASNGGRIAIDFTLAHPERVERLVLVAPAVGGEPPDPDIAGRWKSIEDAHAGGRIDEAIELTLQMWVDGPRRPPGAAPPEVRHHVAMMLRDLYTRSPDNDAGTALELTPAAYDRLEHIRCPTSIVVGAGDFDSKLEVAEHLECAIPGARRVVLATVAHLPSLEAAEEFNRLLGTFLDQ